MGVLDGEAEREFREFARSQTPGLIRAAYLLTGDAHHAQDIVQSALANTALRWSTAVENPRAYVRKALYHQAVSWWRWRGRRPEALPGVLPDVALDQGDEFEQRIVVRAALAKLTYGWAADDFTKVKKGSPQSEIRIVTLATGRTVRLALPGVGVGDSVDHIIWSADGTRLLVQAEVISEVTSNDSGSGWVGTIDTFIVDAAMATREGSVPV